MSDSIRSTTIGVETWAAGTTPTARSTTVGVEVWFDNASTNVTARSTAVGVEVWFDNTLVGNLRRRRVASLILDDRPLA